MLVCGEVIKSKTSGCSRIDDMLNVRCVFTGSTVCVLGNGMRPSITLCCVLVVGGIDVFWLAIAKLLAERSSNLARFPGEGAIGPGLQDL